MRSLLFFTNVSLYSGEERRQFLRRVKARGAPGDQVLNAAREVLRRGRHWRPELHDSLVV